MYQDHWFGGGIMWIFFVVLILIVFWGGNLYSNKNSGDKE